MEINFTDETCHCGCGSARGKTAQFAPGHDARFKGELARHIASEGDDATVTVNGDTIAAWSTAEAVGSTKLATKVMEQVERLRNKPERKPRAPRAAKAKPAEAAEDGTRFGVAYVGRWRYPGRLSADGARFTYTERGGDGQSVTTDQWREFEEVDEEAAKLGALVDGDAEFDAGQDELQRVEA